MAQMPGQERDYLPADLQDRAVGVEVFSGLNMIMEFG